MAQKVSDLPVLIMIKLSRSHVKVAISVNGTKSSAEYLHCCIR
jgi:hypothetical protein